MSISLKILLVDLGTTKTCQYTTDTYIQDVCTDIRAKYNYGEGGLDHGLLLKDQGIWLASNKMIGHYEFKFGDVLEFKKKHRVLKVKTLDNTFKTILIDESLSVKDLVDLICERIGLSNSEEYSLQKEEVETKSQTKDKKLKKIEGMSTGSSNITTYIEGWLNPDKTLREQGLSDDEPVILKKKFFFTDQNVDRSDPVQMGLIYSQSHQMIISGKLPVTAEEAGQFGGIRMQILYGNQDPEKHKLGFAKMKELVPPEYQKSKDVEKLIYKEHSILQGTSDYDSKFRYVQLIRSLPTYGTSFFIEPAEKKKKATFMLLGVTKQSVIRMEIDTKATITEWKLTQLRRWAATANNFTLDFGDYSEEYYQVETTEGTEISRLISGYIDIIIKKRNQLHTMAQDKKREEKAMVEDYARPQKSAKVTLVTNANSKQSAKVLQAVSYASNIEPAIRDGHRAMMGEDAETVEGQSLLMKQLNQGLLSMDGVLQEMYIPIQLPPVSQDTASIKWRSDTFDMNSENVKAHITAIMAALGILIKNATGDKLRMDFEKMGHQLTTYFSSVIEIGQSLRFLSALDSQANPNNEDELLSSSKAMVESMSDFVKEYKAVTTGYTLLDKLHQSSRVVSDNGFKLFSAVGGSQLFESIQKELINSAVEVQIAMDQLVGCGKKISKDFTDAQSKHVLEYHTLEASASSAVLVANTMVLGNYMVGSICKEQLIAATDNSRKQTDEIYTLCSNCPDEQLLNELHKAIQGTDDSLGYLIERSKMTYTGLDYEIVHCINQICYSTDGLENDLNDKEALFSSAKHLTVNATKLVECLKLAAAEATNYEQQTHLTKEVENLAALIGSVVAATRSVIKNFSDKNAKAKLLESVFQQKEGSLIAGDHYLKNDIFQQLIAAMESAVLTSILTVSAARHSSLSNRNRENMLALTKSGKDCNATVPQSINAAKNLKNNMYNHYYRAKLIQAATCFVGPADAMVKGGLKSISDITDNYSKIHLNSLCNTLNSDVLRLKKLLENEIYYFNEVEFADALLSKVESPPNTQTLSMAEAEIIEHSKILLASLNDAVGKISDISSNGWRSDITTAMTEYHNIKGIFTNPNISEDQKLYGELMNASDRVENSIREMIISSKKKDALEMGQNVGKSSQNVGTLIDSLPQKKAILQSLGNFRKMTNVGFKVSEVERTGAEFVEGDLERQDALLSVAADLSAAIQALVNGSKGNEAELKSNMEKLKKQYGNLISVSNDMSKRGQGGNFGTVIHSTAKELDSFLGSLQHSFKDTGSEEFGAQLLLAARNVTDTIDGLYGIFSAENSAGEVCGKSLQKINTASGHVSNINAPKPQNKTYEEITHYAQTALSALREHQTIFKNALSSMDGIILANEGLIITAEMEKLIGNSIHGAHILAAADPQSQNAQPSSINQDFVLTTCKLLRDSASKITNKEATPASSYENSGTIVKNVGVLCQEISQTDRLNDIDPHLKKEIVSLAQALAQSTSILDPVIKNMKPNSREWLATVEPLKADFLQKLLDLETLCKLKNFTGKSAKPGRTAITLQAPILEASTVAIESARNAVELIKGGTLAQSKGKYVQYFP